LDSDGDVLKAKRGEGGKRSASANKKKKKKAILIQRRKEGKKGKQHCPPKTSLSQREKEIVFISEGVACLQKKGKKK